MDDVQKGKKTWTVFVDDNFHIPDWDRMADERVSYGEFDTYEKAEFICEQIVNRSLEKNIRNACDAENLYSQYIFGGSDPFIVGPKVSKEFDARLYARAQCEKLFPPALEKKNVLQDQN